MLLQLLHLPRRLLGLPQLLSQLLPSSCALCGQTDRNALCQPCQQRYFQLRPRRCVQCAMPIAVTAKEIRCGECLKKPPAFDATLVVTDYAAPADQLVLGLKFGARLALAPVMADMLHHVTQQASARGLPLPNVLTAVPLSQQRLHERGFNQSLEVARPLARKLDMQLEPQLLIRVRDTLAQASLPLDARKRNMHRAFVVATDGMNHVRDAHVGVVDDVMTTGETLNEIATTLKRFGAQRVTNIVFARTPTK